jgi:hypothetical protein
MLLLLQTDHSKRQALPMRHGIHTGTLAQLTCMANRPAKCCGIHTGALARQTCMATRPENRSQSTPLVTSWRVLSSKLICITTAPKWWSLPQW